MNPTKPTATHMPTLVVRVEAFTLPTSQASNAAVSKFITRLLNKLGVMSPRHSCW